MTYWKKKVPTWILFFKNKWLVFFLLDISKFHSDNVYVSYWYSKFSHILKGKKFYLPIHVKHPLMKERRNPLYSVPTPSFYSHMDQVWHIFLLKYIFLNQRLSRACIVHLVIKKNNWSYVKTMSCVILELRST